VRVSKGAVIGRDGVARGSDGSVLGVGAGRVRGDGVVTVASGAAMPVSFGMLASVGDDKLLLSETGSAVDVDSAVGGAAVGAGE